MRERVGDMGWGGTRAGEKVRGGWRKGEGEREGGKEEGWVRLKPAALGLCHSRRDG